MLATRNSRWIAGALGVCLLLAVGSWFLLVGPRLDRAAQLRDQAVSARAQNDTLQTQIDQLVAQSAELPKKEAELAKINKEFPAVAEVPDLLRSISTLAGTSGVTVNSLSPGSASYAGGSGAAVGAAATGTAAGAAPDANALVSIPVSMAVDGDYFQAAQFVKQLQTSLNRAFLVSSVTVTAGGSGGDTESTGAGSSAGSATSGRVGLQITGAIFALPDKAAAAAGTTGTTGAVVNGTTSTTNGATN